MSEDEKIRVRLRGIRLHRCLPIRLPHTILYAAYLETHSIFAKEASSKHPTIFFLKKKTFWFDLLVKSYSNLFNHIKCFVEAIKVRRGEGGKTNAIIWTAMRFILCDVNTSKPIGAALRRSETFYGALGVCATNPLQL